MPLPSLLHSVAATAFHHGGGLAAVRWLHRDSLRILMYHRFSDRAALARQCAHVRRYYQPVTMAAIAACFHAGNELPRNALAVTIDDGYGDFLEFGYPVFAEYGIPVTVFLVTDFLDGKCWLWFDRVLYAFLNTRLDEAAIDTPDGKVSRVKLGSMASRRAAGHQVAAATVALTAAERRDFLAHLPRLLQVDIPDEAPPEYGPLKWDAVRSLAASGVEFGAHTKTHPILSALTDPEELDAEIGGSKARIESELAREVLHFCYPNGKREDFGRAAVRAVRNAGMQTAVTAEPGVNERDQNAYLLHRNAVDPGQEPKYFARLAAGVEQARALTLDF